MDNDTNIELTMLHNNRLLQFCLKSSVRVHMTLFKYLSLSMLNKWLLHQFQMVSYRSILSKLDTLYLYLAFIISFDA